jgi:hypothetical protein
MEPTMRADSNVDASAERAAREEWARAVRKGRLGAITPRRLVIAAFVLVGLSSAFVTWRVLDPPQRYCIRAPC